MSWIPDPPVILVLLQKIEEGENLLQDSCELFWRFCLQSMDPDQFKERTEFWINRQLEDSPKGGGFQDPKIRNYILSGPEKLSQVIINKLDELSKRKFVPYVPDESEDPIALHVYLYIESSRLARFLKLEQYSERSRESLINAINVFNRCNKASGIFPDKPWAPELSVSFFAIGSFLFASQFRIQQSDGQYESAMESLAHCYGNNLLASYQFPKYGFPNPKAEASVSLINSIGNVWEKSPWMQDLAPQEPVDCFEAILAGRNRSKLKAVADICSFFVTVAKSWWPIAQGEWPNEEQEIEVMDSKGETWSLPEYWQHAAGWAEAQLQPSELRDLLNEREDQAAENRLRTYFFGERLWDKLPERARRSIVSADRDWFSGSVARTESILNELQIATTELLTYGLWDPMGEWLGKNNTNKIDTSKYDELVFDLKSKNRSLTALDLERTCRMPVTVKFLTSKGISKSDLEWITKLLPTSIFKLRQARNRAEHVSGSRIEREELNRFYNEFLGIGQTGIIRKIFELCDTLDNKAIS
jgi:hypothetical protein